MAIISVTDINDVSSDADVKGCQRVCVDVKFSVDLSEKETPFKIFDEEPVGTSAYICLKFCLSLGDPLLVIQSTIWV